MDYCEVSSKQTFKLVYIFCGITSVTLLIFLIRVCYLDGETFITESVQSPIGGRLQPLNLK